MISYFLQDVGQAVLESYSRILETLAHSVLSKIEDVMYADAQTIDPTTKRGQLLIDADALKKLDPKEEVEKLNNMEAPNSMTLSDFMGWHLDQEELDKKETGSMEDTRSSDELGNLKKAPIKVVTNRRLSYIEKLENSGGMRSPTARH